LPPVATPPDDHTSQFAFDRYGLRVPAILISPYISAGRIIDTVFDHSSIPAMIKKNFGLPEYLTKRDAQANTFEAAFDLTIARTDAPRNLGTAPLAASDEWGDQVATPDQLKIKLATGDVSSAPISDHQMSLVELARSMTAVAGDRIALLDHARPMTTEHDAAVYLRQAAERLRQLRRRRSNLLIKK